MSCCLWKLREMALRSKGGESCPCSSGPVALRKEAPALHLDNTVELGPMVQVSKSQPGRHENRGNLTTSCSLLHEVNYPRQFWSAQHGDEDREELVGWPPMKMLRLKTSIKNSYTPCHSISQTQGNSKISKRRLSKGPVSVTAETRHLESDSLE